MIRTLTPVLLLALALPATAQNTVTVSTAAGNAEQVWYSLQNGEVATAALADWDLAFEIAGFTASIRVNTQKGMRVFKAPYAVQDWASLDTTGMLATWKEVHDSDTSWSHGALNDGLTSNEFDLGWGVYNQVTHIVAGDSVFVLQLANGDWKKLRIDGLATGTYAFTWANVDGSDEQSGSLNKGAFMGKNFGYYSFANGVVDLEPLSADWDLVFTKFIGYVPSAYPVAGVLQNKDVPALQIDGVPTDQADWTSAPFDSVINVIGSDWKTFNMQTFQYEYPADRTYFVKDRSGNVWKLIFTEYGGSANGDMTFTQELVSATGVDELTADRGVDTVYPMPVQNGLANLVLDVPVRQLDVTVHDLGGRVVRQERLGGLDGLVQRTIDLAGAPAGLYVMRLQAPGFDRSMRLVVE